jgi:hypothetical protein
MKLINTSTAEVLVLPNDMLWENEFDWSPVLSDQAYSTTGALFIDQWVKQAGRPISLRAAEEDMGWVRRSVAQTLIAWAAAANLQLQLVFEYPTDVRSFNVVFDGTSGQPVTAVPVTGFPGHNPLDWFRVTIKLTEV